MKVALCVLVFILVVSVDALPNMARLKRGFRTGAADRFSHGFGKRAEGLLEQEEEEPRPVMTVGDMVELLRSNPRLAYIFVKQHIDTDGDGIVSQPELFGSTLSQ